MIRVSADTLKRLGAPAVVAVVLLAGGIAALVATGHYAQEAGREYGAARAERASVQTKLARATDEEREIQARLVDYQNLRQRGVLGDERRLDWVETVKRIKSERQIYDLRYSIEPRRPLEFPGVRQEPGVELLQSRMRLEVSLLHEDDLFNLLDDLRTRLAPVVVVRNCTLNRTERSRVEAGAGPRLRAECAIDLVTIRDTREVQ